MNVEIQKAIQVAREGGIIVFPTDTAFGIGCRIDREDAVERLFKLRHRPLTKAVPVLFDSLEMVKAYTRNLNQDCIDTLIKPHWPGALTIILSANLEKVPSLIRGGESTIGVRIPNHKDALALIQGVGVPFVGTSANFAGEPTPYTFSDLDPELLEVVDYVMQGECTLKKESTVIDTTIFPWKILRQGAVSI